MNRRIQKVGLAASLVACAGMLPGCEAWEDLSAEAKGLFSGAGAGLAAALIASSMGANDTEAILIGLGVGLAVGLIVYAANDRPATSQEQQVIARQSEELRTQSDPALQSKLQEQNVLVYRPLTPLEETPPGTQTVAYQAYDAGGQPVGNVVELDRATVAQAIETQAEGAQGGPARVTEVQRREGTHKAIILDA